MVYFCISRNLPNILYVHILSVHIHIFWKIACFKMFDIGYDLQFALQGEPKMRMIVNGEIYFCLKSLGINQQHVCKILCQYKSLTPSQSML